MVCNSIRCAFEFSVGDLALGSDDRDRLRIREHLQRENLVDRCRALVLGARSEAETQSRLALAGLSSVWRLCQHGKSASRP